MMILVTISASAGTVSLWDRSSYGYGGTGGPGRTH
jgi:hypothetical protein